MLSICVPSYVILHGMYIYNFAHQFYVAIHGFNLHHYDLSANVNRGKAAISSSRQVCLNPPS